MSTSPRQKKYLQAMGIPLWSARRELPGEKPAMPDQLPAESVLEHEDFRAVASDEKTWLTLQQAVKNCTACDLHQTRTNTVFGVGNAAADWMIIGAAPDQEADRQGEPFVGKAGLLLNQMLEAVGLSRDKVFITNLLKCSPAEEQNPRPEQLASCADFLLQQIQWIKPKIILSVGAVSAQNLLQVNDPIGQIRGQLYQHPITATPIVVTYHPAYLLRAPFEKRKAWHDLLLAKKTLQALQ